LVDSLISEANGRGGLDNITAIVIQVSALDEDTRETPSAGAPTLEVPTFPPGDGGRR
jgi:serine/threonine protein phosphatase PrpC